MCKQLVCRQIARLAPVEDSLGDVGGEIAEADKPGEIGWADAFPLGKRGKRHAELPASAALNRRALISSLISRASGFTVANGSEPSIRIVISRPARRSRIGTDRIWISSSLALGNGVATSRSTASRVGRKWMSI